MARSDSGERIFKISNNLKCYYIIISALNISNKQLNEIITGFEELENVKLLILTEGIHPNEYVSEDVFCDSIEPIEDNFKRVDKILNRL